MLRFCHCPRTVPTTNVHTSIAVVVVVVVVVRILTTFILSSRLAERKQDFTQRVIAPTFSVLEIRFADSIFRLTLAISKLPP